MANVQVQQSLQATVGRRLLAWCVHFYTALGLVAAAGIAVLLVQNPPDFRGGFLLMFVALLIDATDGTFARRVRVKEVLPGFDGRRLDDIIDFLTYTCLPLFLVYQAEILPRAYDWWLLLPLLASAYGFSQVFAKTEDGYFLGFPSYWNLVGFYLYVLRPPAWLAMAILGGLALLTFVPMRYLYPSQRGRLNRLTNLLGGLWAILVVYILWRLPARNVADVDPLTRRLGLVSLFFPLYYLVVSWGVSWRLWRRARSPGPARS